MDIGISIDIFSTGIERWGENRYKKLGEIGYKAIDFNMANTETDIYSLPEPEAKKLLLHEKELTEKAGMRVNQVHGPWRWPPRDFTFEDRAERMEKMKKSIKYTALLGSKLWIVHPIMPYGMEETGTENEEKTYELNISFMKELLITAKENNVIICLENMPMTKFSLAKPKDILRLVKEINDDNFKICLDTGHVSVFNELSLGDSLRELGNNIRAFHIHDNKFGADLHLFPYTGIIDWNEFSKALKDIKFNGVFSLETAPNPNLPDDVYESFFRLLYKISTRIIVGQRL